MNNETDLDWLARHVHVWPEGMREVLVCYPRNVDTLIWSCVSSNTGWVTKDQWLSRRAELQNKPGWDKAEDWAEWLAQDQDGEWKWLAGLPGKYVDGWTAVKIKACCKGLALGDWRDTLERRPQAEEDITEPFDPEFRSVTVSNETIPLEQPVVVASTGDAIQGKCPNCGNTGIHACLGRKVTHTDTANEIAEWVTKQQEMKQDNGWFERGERPPLGRCLIKHKNATSAWAKPGFNEVTIVAAGNELFITVDVNGGQECVATWDDYEFRPIRTEREVLLSIIVEEMNRYDTDGKLADAILASGFSLGDK